LRGARYTAFAAALLFGPAALLFGPVALLFGPAALSFGPAALSFGPGALSFGPGALLFGPAALLFGPAALSFGLAARVFGLAALLFGPAVYAGDAPRLGIEQIMADPDWIGAPVRDAYWSGDGRSAYYWLKRSGSPIVDLHRVDIGGRRDQVVDAPDMAGADGPTVYDVEGRRAAFVRNGDLFLRELGSGRLTQITRTPQVESSPQFSADGQLLSFRVGRDWWVYDVRGGVSAPAAVLMLEKDPDAAPKPDDLHDMQMRTYATLRRLHEEKEQLRRHADDLQKSDSTRSALPFYLGDEVSVVDTSLSPDAHWLLVVTEPKSAEAGFEGKFTRYVTESGYEEFGKERVRVGRNAPAPQSLLLLDLTAHTAHALPLDPLPGIEDDPLSAVRAENGGQDPHAGMSSGHRVACWSCRRTRTRAPGALAGAAMAVRSPLSFAPSTTRIAGSRASISIARCSFRSIGSPTLPGSAGDSMSLAG
jgi:hypothetical protein